jgi:anti-sigma-K factor RskA
MNNNSSNNEHFEELCAAYVLNALDNEEQQEFEGLLEEADQDELEIFHGFRSTATQLSFTVEREEPPASIREQIIERVMADAAKTESATPITSTKEEEENGFSRAAMAIAASFALLLITLALVFYAFNLNSELGNKDDLINQKDAQITELQNEVQQKEELLSILEARSVDLVMMAGLEVNPNGYGKVIWDSEKQQALLQVSNLPSVPTGKEYQFWLIKNNKPVSAGLFAVNDPARDSFFKIEKMVDANKQNANAFAITLEPEGGSQQPTGDMYMLGNVGEQSN